jgi:hypothetical protein
LITAFSLHLVKTGRFPIDLGRALNPVQELRLIAVYKGDPLDPGQAAWSVTQAKAFVDGIRAAFFTQPES